MAKTKEQRDGVEDPYTKFNSDPNVVLDVAPPGAVEEMAKIMKEKAAQNKELLARQEAEGAVSESNPDAPTETVEQAVIPASDDTPPWGDGEPPHPCMRRAPKTFQNERSGGPWMLGPRTIKADADPLLVLCLESFERIIVGGLLIAMASGAQTECRQIIEKLRERICEPCHPSG